MIDNKDTTSKVLVALQYVDEMAYKKRATLLNSVDDISTLSLCSSKGLVNNVLGVDKADIYFENLNKIEDIFAKMTARDVHWLTYLDDEYPDELRLIEDCPLVLFFKGSIEALSSDKTIGIVGTRKPTRYGSKVAQDFATEFAKAGAVVVSGFARGVDSIAHKACIDQNSATVAVFACGLDICYPAEHRGLYDGILQNGGALVSEYPLGEKPLQYHFPERNRIISGLSRAVLLPQAAQKSGSLITMRLAIEQGKDIFVVPGNIYDEESAGNNQLLREMPHALAISPEDVLDAMHIAREVVAPQTIQLSLVQNAVLDELHDCEKHFEDLLEATALSVSELTGVLFDLEIEGLIEKLPGNYYAKA